ncbi:ABC transporter ATP-binding protein [Hylemonella gracilis str. Niagara R]|uniref:ABC transporter ATP-binding protein n=1 Tax=Hylemonella gracilis str. Niagara R TaxID=1458275 RepID=A0A016XKZ8_9BURK|nr:ABC transporter ATP-binding protein [Hylemonella gracilis]EYC52252.1 ABC transporter ATP-binding protein [Hylemonella gracilis str. Niagara R]
MTSKEVSNIPSTHFLHYRHFNGGTIPRHALAFLFTLLWTRFRWRVLALTITSVAGIGLMALEPLFLRDLVEALARFQPGLDASWPSDIWLPFALVAGAWVISAGFNRLREWVDLHTTPALRMEVQTCLFSYLMEHAPAYFQDNFAGRLAQKVKQAGQAAANLLGILFNEITRLIVAIAVGVAIVAPQASIFLWVLLGWTVAYLALSVVLARRCLGLSRALSEEVSRSTGVMVDILGNSEIVRGFARGAHECLRQADAVLQEADASRRLRRFLILMWLLMFNALLAFQISFIALAIAQVMAGTMTVGEMVMIFSLAAILSNNVWNLCARFTDLFENLGIVDASLETLNVPHAIADLPGAPDLRVPKGSITFEGVGFRHGDGTPVFTGLNLAIRPGEKVGLVGPSGSGKSTLIRLLRRQYELQAGRILIDGQDIAQVSLASLNRAIAEVPQDPGLFHRSIGDNIRYARPEAPWDEVLQAARQAHCDTFIRRRPGGYEAVVGERGVLLSGGERQRVAIARAFLKQARILLLDEATSALDSETEHAIRDALWNLFEGRTVIAIAHRLSTVSRMDRILYMEGGQIREEGSHEALLAQGGAYARLWARQVDGFIADDDE